MEEKENIENFNRELLAKYLSNEVNSREKLEVESWLNQSEINRDELEQNRQMFRKVDVYYQLQNFSSGVAWRNVQRKIDSSQNKIIQQKKVRKETITKFYKYAAVIVVALLLGSIGYYFGFKNQVPAVYSEIISGDNQVLQEFVLPDGSVVTLNSQSKLLFPKKFKNNVREVTVIGEAFFDVQPNPEKPFVINAGNAQIKVLGTSFNVCAYPEKETVEVVVKTGTVQVLRKNTDLLSESQKVILVPGEKGTLFNASAQLEKGVNTNPNFLAWKTHDLVFTEIPLEQVVDCLQKIYNIEIEITEPGLNKLLLTAHFNQKPINFILDVIRLTFNLELTVENEQFTLASRKTNK